MFLEESTESAVAPTPVVSRRAPHEPTAATDCSVAAVESPPPTPAFSLRPPPPPTPQQVHQTAAVPSPHDPPDMRERADRVHARRDRRKQRALAGSPAAMAAAAGDGGELDLSSLLVPRYNGARVAADISGWRPAKAPQYQPAWQPDSIGLRMAQPTRLLTAASRSESLRREPSGHYERRRAGPP